MKILKLLHPAALLLITALCAPVAALAQVTAFTYQGRLSDSAGPVNGSYDFSFQLFDAASGGANQGSLLSKVGVTVSDGLFTVTLDFGAGPFSAGDPRWLEIKVRTNNAGAYGLIDPRLPLTATPYAVTAGNVVSGGLAAGTYSNALTLSNPTNSVNGTFSGNGANVTNVNAATLNGLTGGSFWKINGNAGASPSNGAFLGTADNLPLEIRVNGQHALRIEPTTNTANVIGGNANNFVAPGVYGATIGGGGTLAYPGGNNLTNAVFVLFGTVGGGVGNAVGPDAAGNGDSATVAGGWLNSAFGNNTTIGGGAANTNWSNDSVISGGTANSIQTNAYSSAIGGGFQNTIQSLANQSTIGGGYRNTIRTNAYSSTIGGGEQNMAAGPYATVPGGLQNSAFGDFATIGGGIGNSIQTNTYSSTIGGGEQNTIQPLANRSTIGGGYNNTIQPLAGQSTIGGGYNNTIHSNAFKATIGGGDQNTIQTNASQSTIGGGGRNEILTNALYATIGGGYQNMAGGQFATVPGGLVNTAAGQSSFAAGQGARALHDGTFVWADPSSIFAFTSTASNQFLIRATGGVGIGTTAPEAPLHVAEGSAGSVAANPNAIAVFERAGNAYLSVLTPTNSESGVLFGSPTSSVDGGVLFNANVARGLSFRTGGNSTKMVIQSDGFVGIGTQAPTERLHVIGNILASGTITGSSDRNVKEHFAPVNPREVLDRVAALPISRWNYKTETDVTHLGPMAQDFYSAFQVGMDDKHISMVDADGVALAAIQGLNEKVEVRSRNLEEQLQQKQTEITELRRELSEIRQLLVKHSVKGN